MIKLQLNEFERMAIYEIVGIDESQGQPRPKVYPIGQLMDASAILKKMVSEGIPFMGKITFNTGEVELERSELIMIETLFNDKKTWSLDKAEVQKSLAEKLVEAKKDL